MRYTRWQFRTYICLLIDGHELEGGKFVCWCALVLVSKLLYSMF